MRHFNLLGIAATAVAAAALAPTGAIALDHHGMKSTAAKGNVIAGVSSSKDHKTLAAAIRAADLTSTLASGGPYTVFAPTDAAFEELPDGTLDKLLQPANKDQLAGILTYHVIADEVTAAELIALIEAGGGSADLTTVQGGKLTATLDGDNVVITDASGGTTTVVATDLQASNGVIHVTDGVFLPA